MAAGILHQMKYKIFLISILRFFMGPRLSGRVPAQKAQEHA